MTPPERLQDVTLAERLQRIVRAMREAGYGHGPKDADEFMELLRELAGDIEAAAALSVRGEPVGWWIVQKNRLSVGGMYRTRDEAFDSGLFDPETDELIPLYATPPSEG